MVFRNEYETGSEKSYNDQVGSIKEINFWMD